LRVGAVLREQNALPYESSVTNCWLAKDAIDNGGAGRSAQRADSCRPHQTNGRLKMTFIFIIKYVSNN
jgi:hypothetical protein